MGCWVWRAACNTRMMCQLLSERLTSSVPLNIRGPRQSCGGLRKRWRGQGTVSFYSFYITVSFYYYFLKKYQTFSKVPDTPPSCSKHTKALTSEHFCQCGPCTERVPRGVGRATPHARTAVRGDGARVHPFPWNSDTHTHTHTHK